MSAAATGPPAEHEQPDCGQPEFPHLAVFDVGGDFDLAADVGIKGLTHIQTAFDPKTGRCRLLTKWTSSTAYAVGLPILKSRLALADPQWDATVRAARVPPVPKGPQHYLKLGWLWIVHGIAMAGGVAGAAAYMHTLWHRPAVLVEGTDRQNWLEGTIGTVISIPVVAATGIAGQMTPAPSDFSLFQMQPALHCYIGWLDKRFSVGRSDGQYALVSFTRHLNFSGIAIRQHCLAGRRGVRAPSGSQTPPPCRQPSLFAIVHCPVNSCQDVFF